MVKKYIFDKLNDQEIYDYIIKNGNLEASIITYGATIQALKFNGIDTVLGFDNIKSYIDFGVFYMGAMVGRVANRIANGSFTLNGKVYELTKNEKGINCLHGGPTNFGRNIWAEKEVGENYIVLTSESFDGEQGFPANIKAEVKYTVENDALSIEIKAESDGDTVCAFTNHAYFNLNKDHSESVLDDILTVDADFITPTDELNNTFNTFESVSNKNFDLRKGEKLKNIIPEKLVRYNHNFCINNGGKYKKCSCLSNEKTGIEVLVYSDQPGIQVYTETLSERLNIVGKNGTKYIGYNSVCMEAQNYPNAVNCDKYPSAVLRKGEKYCKKITYSYKKV